MPARSVLENVFLGIEPRRARRRPRRELRRRFARARRAHRASASPRRRVGALRTAEQQKVEILRAIARDARLILMDEPTAALTADETDRLLRDHPPRWPRAGRRSCSSRTSSTRCSRSATTVTVMRDGRLVRTGRRRRRRRESLVAAMIGRELDLDLPARSSRRRRRAGRARGARALARAAPSTTSRCRSAPARSSASPGLVGSGRTEIARALFGADRLDAGEVLVDGAPVRLRNPRDAARAGIAMLPESRKDQGLLMLRSVRENATLATLAASHRGGVVRRGARARAARASWPQRLDVRAPRIERRVGTPLGRQPAEGAVREVARRRPRVLLADEPTRGVDVGAKRADPRADRRLAGGRHGGAADLLRDRGGARARAPRPRDARRPGGRGVRRRRGRPRRRVMRAAFASRRATGGAEHEPTPPPTAPAGRAGARRRRFQRPLLRDRPRVPRSVHRPQLRDRQVPHRAQPAQHPRPVGAARDPRLRAPRSASSPASSTSRSARSSASSAVVADARSRTRSTPTSGSLRGRARRLGLGIVNGVLIHVTRINSFIGTLATSIVFRGLAILVTGGSIVTVHRPGVLARSAPSELLGREVVGVGVRWPSSSLTAFLLARTRSAATSTRSAATTRRRASPASASGWCAARCFALSGLAAGHRRGARRVAHVLGAGRPRRRARAVGDRRRGRRRHEHPRRRGRDLARRARRADAGDDRQRLQPARRSTRPTSRSSRAS